eukprot:3023-Heterococcus_DN1.PRE.2
MYAHTYTSMCAYTCYEDIRVQIIAITTAVCTYSDSCCMRGALQYCENWAYAQPKIEQLRQRNVRLVMPARNGEAVATVTQTRHLYPFGAAMAHVECVSTVLIWTPVLLLSHLLWFLALLLSCSIVTHYAAVYYIVNAVLCEDLNISPAFKAFFQKHFNTVTDEVYQKWDAQEPNEGQQDWAKGDALYNFAKDNGMYHRAHVILQESGIPQWLSWLPRDGGYRSVQSALWKRLNDYINRYDQFVSDAPLLRDQCESFTSPLTDEQQQFAHYVSSSAWASHVTTLTHTKYLLNKKGSGGKSLLQNDFCFDTFCGPANSISTMVKSTKATGSTGEQHTFKCRHLNMYTSTA